VTGLLIRPALESDAGDIWTILRPILRAGDTYALPREWGRAEALDYWLAPDHDVFVAELQSRVLGTYFLQANQRGGGAHVANCGYATAIDAGGKGVATAMCEHSLQYAAERGFRAMQFNFVVSTNERAVRLWLKLGFDVVGTIPQGFQHPTQRYVDAFVMYRSL
jgi:ribosomal protein S18 acetylase RimI-like enzyme